MEYKLLINDKEVSYFTKYIITNKVMINRSLNFTEMVMELNVRLSNLIS